MSKWIFSLIELKYRLSTPAATEHQQTPEDSASVPRPTHTAALAIPGESTGVAPELGERGFLKVGLPETANNICIFFWLSGRALDSGRQKSDFKSPCLCFFAFLLFFFFCYYTAVLLHRFLWEQKVAKKAKVCKLFFATFLMYALYGSKKLRNKF